MRWMISDFIFHKKPFKKESCSKPAGGIVQADHFGDVPAGALIIPGTEFAAAKKSAGNEFSGKNDTGVDQSTENKVTMAHKTAERSQERGQPIDGKHPDRGGAGEPEVSSPEGLKGGKDDFQEPAQQAAVYIIMNQFSHITADPFYSCYVINAAAGISYEDSRQKHIYTWIGNSFGRERAYMNYREAMAYVEELGQYGSVMGLTTMRELCARLENPQDQLKFVHIAGTNGKGSILAYVSTVLKEAGYKVGRYISPTVSDYRERFQADGRMITQSGLCKYLEAVREAAESMAAEGLPHPTAFEVETAVAFLYFLDKKCDIVVLETGLGGATDATNVVETTLVAAFASISRDHMGILGETLEQIASVKSGIIKNKCYVVSVRQRPEVLKVLRQAALLHKAKFFTADAGRAKNVRYGVTRQHFSYDRYKDLVITLSGQFQIENAVAAVEILTALGRLGYPVTDEQLRKGLFETRWRGRFEVIGRKPLFIADGAHNEDAAGRLAESIRFYFTNKRIIYIMGMLKDKEYDKVIRNTCDLAEHIITVTPPAGVRALHAYELAKAVSECHDSVTAADSIQEAVELACLLAGKDKETVIIAFGSLSYLGELISVVEHRDTIGRDTHGRSEEN